MVSSSYNILFEDAKLFTEFDLKPWYHQTPIESSNIWNTTFKTKEFLFELLVTPFGLTNALEILMGYIDDVIIPFARKCVIIYLDDILIFNKWWDEHLDKLQQVLSTHKHHRLYLNLEKWYFDVKSSKYLCYVIDIESIHVESNESL